MQATENRLGPTTGFWVFMLLGGATIAVLLWMSGDKKESAGNPHTLEETSTAWVVKTQNYNAKPIDTVNLPNVKAHLGIRGKRGVIRSMEYDKNKYSEGDVRKIMREKLAHCPRCTVHKG